MNLAELLAEARSMSANMSASGSGSGSGSGSASMSGSASAGADQPGTAGAALLLLDFQRDILLDDRGDVHAWAADAVPLAKALLSWARRSEVPVIWTRVVRRPDYRDARPSKSDRRTLVAGTKGAALVPQLTPEPDDFEVVKPRVSAFYGTNLDGCLRRLKTLTLVVCGVYTHMAVESTVRDAYDRDLDSIVVSDACASPRRALHENAISLTLPLMADVTQFSALVGRTACVRDDPPARTMSSMRSGPAATGKSHQSAPMPLTGQDEQR